MSDEAVMVLTTVGAGFDARPLAKELVSMRLAACVNVVDGITSIFRWKGEVSEDGETLLVIKTTRARVHELQNALMSRHPYEVPEFLVLSIEATSAAYGAWLADSVSRE